jgi:hypothetical protein
MSARAASQERVMSSARSIARSLTCTVSTPISRRAWAARRGAPWSRRTPNGIRRQRRRAAQPERRSRAPGGCPRARVPEVGPQIVPTRVLSEDLQHPRDTEPHSAYGRHTTLHGRVSRDAIEVWLRQLHNQSLTERRVDSHRPSAETRVGAATSGIRDFGRRVHFA